LDNFERAEEARWDAAEEWHQRARDIASDLILERLAKGDSEALEWVIDRMVDNNVVEKFLIGYPVSRFDAIDEFCSDIVKVLDEYRDWLIDNDLIRVD
jgi:hypothetical protein